jgi:hypothetical protein
MMENEDFRRGDIEIQWLERTLPQILGVPDEASVVEMAALAAALIADRDRNGGVRREEGNGAGASSVAKQAAPSATKWAMAARLAGRR